MATFQHIDSFVRAVYTVIESMLNPDIKAGKPFFNEEPLSKYEVVVLVGVLGDLQGQVICGMTEETAKKIISQMLGMEVQEIDEMGQSAICELKNIIVGTASTNLSEVGYKCNITPPLIILEKKIPDFLKHIHTTLAIPISIPYGDIEINLFLRKDELAS
ncbi:MAG TPA: chemotaxis protein CheX [Firmicutes bacterium]|nr:chemotaxis protein CheX [Bacillota bacterium]